MSAMKPATGPAIKTSPSSVTPLTPTPVSPMVPSGQPTYMTYNMAGRGMVPMGVPMGTPTYGMAPGMVPMGVPTYGMAPGMVPMGTPMGMGMGRGYVPTQPK